MTMPPNTMQIWVGLPQDQFPAHYNSCLVWLYSLWNVTPPGFNPFTFASDFWTWWNATVGQNVYFFAPTFWGGTWYTGWDQNTAGFSFPSSTFPCNVATDCLPAKVCVSIRRLTAFSTTQKARPIAINGLRKQDVDGSYLTPTAFSAWQSSCSNWVNGFVSQSVTYFPFVPYYSVAGIGDPTNIYVNQRTCIVKRRGRQGRVYIPALLGPKTFP